MSYVRAGRAEEEEEEIKGEGARSHRQGQCAGQQAVQRGGPLLEALKKIVDWGGEEQREGASLWSSGSASSPRPRAGDAPRHQEEEEEAQAGPRQVSVASGHHPTSSGSQGCPLRSGPN